MTTIPKGPAPALRAPDSHDAASSTSAVADKPQADFSRSLTDLLQAVDGKISTADELAAAQVRGDSDVQLHDVALALEKADVSMRLMVKTRNKVVEAYQEIMRMPV